MKKGIFILITVMIIVVSVGAACLIGNVGNNSFSGDGSHSSEMGSGDGLQESTLKSSNGGGSEESLIDSVGESLSDSIIESEIQSGNISESEYESIFESDSESESGNSSECESKSDSESVKESFPAEEVYTITFDSAGGTSVPSQKVLNGKKIKKPDAPTKIGYTFTGWFVADDEWNFLAYTVTDDMTLTADWAANTYVISFNVDGGKALADLNVAYDSSFVLPVPEKGNCVFLGWELNGELFENGVYRKTENITLTAKWRITISTITFDAAGGSAVSPMKVNYGESYVLPKSQKNGYVFVGWLYNGELFKDGTILSGDITLMAYWEGLNDIFKYESMEEGVVITEYVGKATDIIVPTKIDDQPVIAIKEGVFANNSSITSVIFDGTFENYTEKMFAGCSSLKSLTISGVFDKALWWLFGDGDSSVPASFTEISFALNSKYIDGYMFKTGGRLAKHTITYVMQQGIAKINEKQFYQWSGLQSVIIPNGVTSIGAEAFCDCSSLTSVIIPDSVISIGEYAFEGCDKSLYTKVYEIIYVDKWAIGVVDKTMVFADIKSGTRGIAGYAFYECSILMIIQIPESVISIGNNAFYNCSSLISMEIPNGVVSIEDGAFSSCKNLARVKMSDSVTSIGDSAFSSCKNLESVTISGGVTTIGDSAFADCVSLTSVVIPDSVINIGASVFSGCSGLTDVTISGSVVNIGNYAFSGCSGLTDVTIPSSVVNIGNYTFSSCSSLMRVTIQSGVASIGYGVFSNCYSLASIEIPGSVTSIGDSAFSDCSSLTCVVIPNSVTGIGEHAFYGCKSLTSVTIPSSVTKIGWCAFYECSRLTNVTFNGTVEEWKNVEKGSSWLRDTKVTVIKCSDGDINL